MIQKGKAEKIASGIRDYASACFDKAWDDIVSYIHSTPCDDLRLIDTDSAWEYLETDYGQEANDHLYDLVEDVIKNSPAQEEDGLL